jgi:hypothetical protein
MVKTQNFEIVGSYNNQRVSEIDAERTVNMFEYIDPLGKKPNSLLWTSGLINTNFTFGTQTRGFRAQYVLLGFMYFVVGSGVFRMDSSEVLTQLGTLTTSEGYVGIDANSFQIIFVDGVSGYIWDTLTSTFVQITDPDFPAKPIDVCTLDNFFVVPDGDTNNFQLSSLNQGLVWGPDNADIVTPTSFTMAAASTHLVLTYPTGVSIANYQVGTPIQMVTSSVAELTVATVYYVLSIVSPTVITVSATNGGTVISSVAGGAGTFTNQGQLQQGQVNTHPGTIVACRCLHRRIFFFSQYFTEIWENAGLGTNLPFRRNNALLIEYGCPAIGSVASDFDMLFFLSQDRNGLGSVMMVIGSQAIEASTRALDYTLARYAATTGISDCRSFLIKENGIIFFRLNFTTSNHTFVYNVSHSSPQSDSTKYWHEEEILNGDRHPAQTLGYFNGKNFVGSYDVATMYILDVNTYTNDTQRIKRTRITKSFVPPGYQRLRVDRLQIDLLQGQKANLASQMLLVPLLDENEDPLLTEDGKEIYIEKEQLVQNEANLFVFMSISKDGGQSYGYSVKAPMGQIGQREFRTLWRKLGVIPRGQGFVAKFEFFNDYPFVILGASWGVEELPE